jgi:class 3 adenylate cyclase
MQSYDTIPGQVLCEDDEDDNNSVDTMKRALRTSFISVAKSLSPPEGNVTIVYTDVQGSTLLWESCPSAMKKAQDIHDTILRQCYSNHKGYEISTEGDSFNLAFQHPVDALAFALQAQIKLYKADWPQEILNHPDGKEEPYLKFKGLRVRIGINHGPTTNQLHRVTGRMIYAGEGVKIAKAMEGLCHGGQILCTIETWKAVGGLAERYLGRPQVIDCGEHLLFDANRTRYSRRIMQIVPNELAFDFFEARGQAEDGTVKDASLVRGRLFPPLPSKKQLSTCFLNAPYAKGRVVICFVHTVGLGDDDGSENRNHNLMKLSKNVRKLLLRSDPPGYECQEDNGCWMLAFGSVDKAVMFGMMLMESIREGGAKEHLLGDVDCENMYKIGIVSGPFTSMGPHKTSGLADYFGPIVNRAARVTSSCEPGQLCVGIPLANGSKVAPPNFGPSIQVRLLGIKQLKGVSVDVAVYGCSKSM